MAFDISLFNKGHFFDVVRFKKSCVKDLSVDIIALPKDAVLCDNKSMKTLIFETKIACDVQSLFDFHADTDNLPRITPPGTKVDILEIDTPLEEYGEVRLLIKKGPIAFEWELFFERVDEPWMIVDVAKRSPFKSFRHEHRFIDVDGTHAILKDIVTFSLPLEPLSSPIAWFITYDMKKMFAYRHKKTKEFLEKI